MQDAGGRPFVLSRIPSSLPYGDEQESLMMPVASAPINGIGTFGDGSLIDQVLRALDTVLSPLASSTERASANQVCCR